MAPNEEKISQWCLTPEDAAAMAAEGSEAGWNVYWAVGLRGKDLGKYRRGTKEEVTGLICFWEDVDYGTAGHKATNLPPTEQEALSLIERLPIRPTIIVHSGHGLQAVWALKEPWMFEDPEEWRQAEGLCKRWSATLRGLAKPKGWTVDSTWSIEHVMRVPGTWNRKPGEEPVRARLLANGGPVICPSDVDEIAVETAEKDPFLEVVGSEAEGLKLDPKAEPPLRKFLALQANDPKFKAALERKRRDLQDQSTTGQDMAAADVMAFAGFAAQEIANTLIFNRVERGEETRCDNRSYYTRTVAKALARARGYVAVNAIEDWYADEAEEPEQKGKEELRRLVESGLEVEIARVRKLAGEPPEYILVTPSGEVKLGTVDGLISQTKLRSAVASVTGRYIPTFKSERWKVLAQALLDLCEVDETGPEGNDAGMLEGWLTAYLEENAPNDYTPEGAATRYPFVKEGRTFISLRHMRGWLMRHDGERITSKELAKALKRWGAEPVVVACEAKGESSTRYVWGLRNGAE